MPESYAWNELPTGFLPHVIWAEIDNKNAFSVFPGITHKALIISQQTLAGTAPTDEIQQIFNADQGDALCGPGSIGARQIRAFKENNPHTNLYCLALDDAGAGVAATGDFTIAGTPTEAGTLNFYIGGERVRIGVATTQTPTDLATALETEINADPQLPVTASAALGVCTLTYKNKGEVGNHLDLRMNYFKEKTPAGLTVTVNAMSGGSGNPDLQDAWDIKGKEKYHHIIVPYADAANFAEMDDEMAILAKPINGAMGRVYAALSDTAGNLSTTGEGRNSQFMSLMGIYNSPTPPEITGTIMGALVAFHGNQHAARPFQLLRMQGVKPPPTLDQFDQTTKNILMAAGINTPIYGAGGFVYLDQLVTSYRKNENNITDASYRWVNVLLILDFINDRFKQTMSKYDRALLGEDGTEVDPGVPLVTPRMAKGDLIGMFEGLEREGYVQNVDKWKDDLQVGIDANNHTRLGAIMPPKLMSQLVQMYGRFEFRLN